MTSRANSIVDWLIYRSTRTALPVIMLSMASVGFVQAMLNPRVAVEADSGTAAPEGLHGTVQDVTVALADPSFTDRFVAALPGLLQLAMIALAYGYLMWEGRSHDYHEKRSVRLAIMIGIAGILVMTAPISIGAITHFYFDVQVPSEQLGVGSLLVGGAFGTLLIGAYGNRMKWMREHERARKLDAELENVV